jgi:hypothetical protein
MSKNVLYIEKIAAADREPFRKKLIDISQKLKVQPNWLTIVMNSESGMNPKAVNSINGASGLIQFVKSTAIGLGTTVEAIRKMSASQQLDYVYKYYKPFIGKLNSPYDIYLVTFFPIALGKPDNWVFQSKNLSSSYVANQNKAIDLNKDGEITIAEFKQWYKNRLGKEALAELQNPTFVIKMLWQNKTYRYIGLGGLVVVAGVVTYFATRK